MTRDQQIADIRDACIKANPDKNWDEKLVNCGSWASLADVLLAIKETNEDTYFKRIHKDPSGPYPVSGTEKICDEWNLRQDDLTKQNDETIQFLYGLLK